MKNILNLLMFVTLLISIGVSVAHADMKVVGKINKISITPLKNTKGACIATCVGGVWVCNTENCTGLCGQKCKSEFNGRNALQVIGLKDRDLIAKILSTPKRSIDFKSGCKVYEKPVPICYFKIRKTNVR